MQVNIFRKKSCVGLDIGSKNIKLVSLIPASQKKFRLKNFQILPLPDDVVQLDTLPENKLSAILSILNDVFSKNKKLAKTVAISVAGSSVVIRYVKLPIMTKEELERSISIEVEPFIPFPINEVYLSFDITGEVIEEGIRKNEVVVAAVKKEVVDTLISLLSKCDLTPAFIDVDSFVLERILNYNYELKGNIICAVNIGANITTVTIIEDGVTRVCRDLTIGMNNFLNEIQKTKQIGLSEILEYIKNDGLILSDEEKEQYLMQNKKTELSISKDLNVLLKDLITEVHKIIDFYYFQKGEQKPLSKIILSGGGCVIRNLTSYFSNEFKVETEVLDPFKNIENSDIVPQEIRPLFAISVGLALKPYIF
ncbi:MAG: type IV pilus assembly protein PilM [Elusimicrobiota bacterium]|nr:type IV pilus assembly protein PilM [Elusimicrobiota bacterium]